ncbi:MAG: branched-chain amino acid ABC transporter permease [Thermovirgaceae bacterium]|jgi:branched-chain amino acid transport system permease protein|nr:branched-chain amino acid ABC transporter permease [Synergistales bacterium]MDI9392218.1 branched-chain amino acid ABC transporter permease [Synergistota bacterium]NLV65367.1 branched-chain amino acid ABC transporter permease [Synergistaceae bacterium]MDD3830768.1 branched-chain amino acid ABC transporter permease [Synergistales bacterium]MDD4023276.1 branched-chain amino acid ABC transporter permease [Synergistales bacterium]
MATFLQVAFDGLLNGLLYALVAAGLSLIWGVMDVINFAHGEFLMIAMYFSYWLGFIWKIDPIISSVAGGAFVFIVGALTYRLVIRRTIGKSAMSALLATFGLSMLIKNICLNRFSPNFRLLQDTLLGGKTFNLAGIIIPVPQLVIGLVALALLFVVYRLVKKTRLGWAIQATAMDKEAAELMGINTERIYLLVFGLGGACVGIAGGLLPSYLAVHPEVGALFSLIAFVCVAMGGFGSIPGALLASLLIGLVEAFAGFYIAPVFKYVAVFGLYLVVVMVRPRGLFGW